MHSETVPKIICFFIKAEQYTHTTGLDWPQKATHFLGICYPGTA